MIIDRLSELDASWEASPWYAKFAAYITAFALLSVATALFGDIVLTVAIWTLLIGLAFFVSWIFVELFLNQRRPSLEVGMARHQGPLPELSPAKEVRVRQLVATMMKHKLFRPDTPDPALLYAGIADNETRVTPDAIFSAIGEVDYYHPGTDPDRWCENLVFHEFHVEQFRDVVAEQVADFARLTGDLLITERIKITQRGDPSDRCRLLIQVSYFDGHEHVMFEYAGDTKYLSTAVHLHFAGRVAALQAGKRLAWFWVDQGVYSSLVEEGAVESLNTECKIGSRSPLRWQWIDETAQ